ncbi:MAG TPA: c-type cytochrome [Thermoanaerobaculia bacterium]|nr:c-type cytochrome [Thermoanaerobaculia bacterium]
MILLLAALLGLTPAELRGRELFTKGTSAAGREVSVTIGGGTVTAAMPCASCHGSDGTGRTEGGVTTPDIRWDALMRKYDERGVVRAITMGTRLSPVMPRYHLWREDATDLLAYLKKLGTLPEPGVSDEAITVGVLTSSNAMRDAVERWAADVNARGGIYTRRIALRFSNDDESFVFIGDGVQTPADAPLVATRASDDPGPLVFSVEPLNILAAASVVEETLRRAGRGVTRESFVTTLESLRDFRTPFGPPLTFSRTHHRGTSAGVPAPVQVE